MSNVIAKSNEALRASRAENKRQDRIEAREANARLIAAAPETAAERDQPRETVNVLREAKEATIQDALKLAAERDRLRAINAGLLAALLRIQTAAKCNGFTRLCEADRKAVDTAIDRATEGQS